jgi:hypothetical protein
MFEALSFGCLPHFRQIVSAPRLSMLVRVLPFTCIDNNPIISDSDLYAYWPLNEGSGSTTTPLGQFTTPAALLGGAAWTTGKVGGGISFNGSAFIPVNIPFVVSETFTVAVWVKPVTTITIRSESTSGTGGTPGQQYAIEAGHGGTTGNAGCLRRLYFLIVSPLSQSD